MLLKLSNVTGNFSNVPQTSTIFVPYHYLIYDPAPSVSISCIVLQHVIRMMLNSTERFYTFSFLDYML